MKFLILFSFLTSFSSMASNWMPLSQIQNGGIQGYNLESDCKKTGEQCLDVGAEPEIVKLGFASLENDWGPESEVEDCADEQDCIAKEEAKTCPGSLYKFRSNDHTKVYCISLLGKSLVKNEIGFSAYKAQQLAKAQLAAGLAAAKKMRECGEGIIDLFLVRNAPKGLTIPQVEELSVTFAPIQNLLLNGSLVTAKAKILEAPVDGVKVTDADKAALAGAADKCLGL